MSVYKNIADLKDAQGILACPRCKKNVIVKDELFECSYCGVVYKKDENNIFNFITRSLSSELQEELKWYEPKKDIMFASNSRGHFYAHNLARKSINSILTKLGANRNSKVLCIAVGDGMEIPLIKPITEDIIGIDIASVGLKMCISNHGIHCLLAEAQLLPFKNNSFDFIIVSAFVHHFFNSEERDEYFNEFRRIIKEKGWLIIIEPNMFYPLNAILYPARIFLEKLKPGAWGGVKHEKPVSPSELKRVLIKNGFIVDNWEATTFVHNRFPLRLCKTFERTVDRLRKTILKWFGWWFVMYAQKNTEDV